MAVELCCSVDARNTSKSVARKYIATRNFAPAMYQNIKEINTGVFSEFCRKSRSKYVILNIISACVK